MPKLKGVTTIQLFDAKTGELQKEIKEENMITNAIENILNPPDYLATGLNTDGTDKSINLREWVEPVYSRMLNGILIFDKNIEEDANITMPPFDCKEIGHAGSVNGVSGDAYSRIGTYNLAESGDIPNGYRRVWDFASDRANGKIACVCLTSNAGGNVGQNPQQDFVAGGVTFEGFAAIDSDSYLNLWRQRDDGRFSSNSYAFYIGQTTNGDIKILVKSPETAEINEMIINNPFKVGLFRKAAQVKSVRRVFSLNNNENTYVLYDWTTEYSTNPGDAINLEKAKIKWDEQNDDSKFALFYPYVYKNQIHIIYQTKFTSESQIRHLILSLNDYSVIQDKKISLEYKTNNSFIVANGSYYDSGSKNYIGEAHFNTQESAYTKVGCFFFDNHYFYIGENNNLIVANDDGTTYQVLGSVESYGTYIDDTQNICIFGGARGTRTNHFVYWLKKDSDTAQYYLSGTRTSNGGNYDSTAYSSYLSIPAKTDKCRLPNYITYNYMKSGSTWGHAMNNMNFYIYLGSINNLATPVTKQPGQTMKITYDITEVQ